MCLYYRDSEFNEAHLVRTIETELGVVARVLLQGLDSGGSLFESSLGHDGGYRIENEWRPTETRMYKTQTIGFR